MLFMIYIIQHSGNSLIPSNNMNLTYNIQFIYLKVVEDKMYILIITLLMGTLQRYYDMVNVCRDLRNMI